MKLSTVFFAAVIRLRYTQPYVPRAYKIPGGNLGLWIVAGTGLITCALTLFLGFMPPAQLHNGNILFYESFLIGGVIIFASIPFLRRFNLSPAE